MPVTLRITGSGVNAVVGRKGVEGVSGILRGVAGDFAIGQCLLQLLRVAHLTEDGFLRE